MRGWIVLLVFAVLVTELSHAATFHGEIGDSSCALNVHSLSRSHKEMLKSRSFGPDAVSCARHCVVQFASWYVLVEKKNVYRLDNQEKAEKWAGQTVIVTGELDVKRNLITIGSIQLAQSPK